MGSDIYKIVSNTHVGCCKKHPNDEELFQTLDPTRKKTKKKSGKKDNGNMTAVAPDGSIKNIPKKKKNKNALHKNAFFGANQLEKKLTN